MIGKILRKMIVVNDLYARKEKLYSTYVSKHNSNRKKQLITLMIPNWEGWHYLVVKKLSTLLKGIIKKWFLLFEMFSFF